MDPDLRPALPSRSLRDRLGTLRRRVRPGAGTPSIPAGVRRLVCALFFVSGVAQMVIVPLLPHLGARYHLSASESALVLALPGLTMLLVSIPAGVAADRFGPRRVTLASGVLLVLAGVLQSAPSLTALLAGRVLFGVAF